MGRGEVELEAATARYCVMGREHDFRSHPARRAPGPSLKFHAFRPPEPAADKCYNEFYEILTWANTQKIRDESLEITSDPTCAATTT